MIVWRPTPVISGGESRLIDSPRVIGTANLSPESQSGLISPPFGCNGLVLWYGGHATRRQEPAAETELFIGEQRGHVHYRNTGLFQ